MRILFQKFFSSFINKFFHLLYHQFAWSYDIVSFLVSLGKWNEWIRSINIYITDGKILELGYGTGHLQISLNREGKEVYGLDRSIQMGKISNKRITRMNYSPNLVNGETQHIPFMDCYFDHIVSTFPSEYFADRSTISEIHRVLKPEGQVVILISSLFKDNRLVHRVIRWLFIITGQAFQNAEDHYRSCISDFTNYGFNITLEKKGVHSSDLFYLVAIKKW